VQQTQVNHPNIQVYILGVSSSTNSIQTLKGKKIKSLKKLPRENRCKIKVSNANEILMSWPQNWIKIVCKKSAVNINNIVNTTKKVLSWFGNYSNNFWKCKLQRRRGHINNYWINKWEVFQTYSRIINVCGTHAGKPRRHIEIILRSKRERHWKQHWQ
jgi:hypothetical protein